MIRLLCKKLLWFTNSRTTKGTMSVEYKDGKLIMTVDDVQVKLNKKEALELRNVVSNGVFEEMMNNARQKREFNKLNDLSRC